MLAATATSVELSESYAEDLLANVEERKGEEGEREKEREGEGGRERERGERERKREEERERERGRERERFCRSKENNATKATFPVKVLLIVSFLVRSYFSSWLICLLWFVVSF